MSKTCYIIGEGTLVIPCIAILQRYNFSILGVITEDSDLEQWAQNHKLLTMPFSQDLQDRLEPFDYLFSILNLHIISKEVLALPGKMAINYHDAPLPKYAGVHATSWAIINQEKEYGITWHEVEEGIDTGDILKQCLLKVSPNDTAFELNTRCYKLAIESFGELVRDIDSNQVMRRSQVFEKRTYFRKSQRPRAIIAWNTNASDIRALVNALDFGPIWNPLGLPKILIRDQLFIVSDLEILASRSSLPGKVVAVNSSLVVCTGTYDVAIHKLYDQDGREVLINQLQIEEGSVLPSLSVEDAHLIQMIHEKVARYEVQWREIIYGKAASIFLFDYQEKGPTKNSHSEYQIPKELLELHNSLDISLDDFVLGLFVIFLSRLKRETHLRLGLITKYACDNTAAMKFFFAYVLPFVVEVEKNKGWQDVLQRIATEMEKMEKLKTYPLDLLARMNMRSSESISTKTKFDVALTKQRVCIDAPLENYCIWEVDADGKKILWHYPYSKRIETSIAKVQESFLTFIKNLVAKTYDTVAEIPLLSLDTYRKLIDEWSQGKDHKINSQATVAELISQQAQRTPHHVAIECGSQVITYAELELQSNSLAYSLQNNERTKQVKYIGVCMSRSIDFVITLLGVLKAGKTFIAIDPKTPRDRLEFIIQNSELQFVFVNQDICELPDCIETTSWDTFANLHTRAVDWKLSSSKYDLAYVIYTSGSTGQPKGAMITHQGLSNYVQFVGDYFEITPEDRVLQFAALSFDTCFEEIFPCLIKGATLVLRNDSMMTNVAEFLETCRLWKISVLDFPTSYWHVLVDYITQPIEEYLPNLRLVVIGGEKAQAKQIAKWQSSNIRLLNGYGPTEATIACTMHEVNPKTDTSGSIVGRPISGTEVYLLDQDLNPVEVGEIGSIYIGGVGLAQGYLNNEEITDRYFLAHPFRSGKKIYKTGDLGRYDGCGNIEFIGREDRQIKVEGFRVELGEIEQVICSYETITQAVVDAEGDHNQVLSAYILGSYEKSKLRDYLEQKLPDYMIPTNFFSVESFPLTLHGKIDLLALKKLVVRTKEREEKGSYEEEKIRECWRRAFSNLNIRLTDNFFQIGGNSLIALQILSYLEKEFACRLPISILHKHPTIQKLANLITQPYAEEHWRSIVRLQKGQKKTPFFWLHSTGGTISLSFQQFNLQLDPEQPIYGIQVQGLLDDQLVHSTVEDMASHYVEELKNFCEGPYLLGGTCLGCNITWEVAQQLKQQNEEVKILLMDPFVPQVQKNKKYHLMFLLHNFRRLIPVVVNHLCEIYKTKLTGPLYASDHIHNRIEKIIDQYSLKYYDGEVTCVVSSDRDGYSSYPWNTLAKKINWHVAEGTTHKNLFRDPSTINFIHEFIQKHRSS